MSQNELLWHTLDMGNVLGLNFSFKKSYFFNVGNKINRTNCNPPDFVFLHMKNNAPPYTSSDMVQTVLK